LFRAQTVHISSECLETEFNIDISKLEPDVFSRHKTNDRWTEKSILRQIFPGCYIDIFDRSDYEGANIVVDLCMPLDKSLYGMYDLVYTVVA